MKKKLIKMKYSAAFKKRDAKHYLIYKVLEQRKVPQAFEVSSEILEELDKFPR